MEKVRVTEENKADFSKFLAYILRHKPEAVGLKLMDGGYVDTNSLIFAINSSDSNEYLITLDDLIDIVKSDSKNRYSFKETVNDKYKFIRANQGHSIKNLKMDFESITPPKILFHGTSKEAAEKILQSKCIKPMSRQYVHLSKDFETAINVGLRHCKNRRDELVVLIVYTDIAMSKGVKFFKSENGVYLSTSIPTDAIAVCTENINI